MALPDYTSQANQSGGGKNKKNGQGAFTPSFPDAFYRPRYQPTGTPDYNAGHPYLDPNYGYGGKPGHTGTEYFDVQANGDPQAYYAYWLAHNGYDSNGAQSKLARGLYNRYQQGYSAAQLTNPELQWTDYLGQQNIGNTINSMSLENQGVDTGRYTGRDRWGLRGG